MIDSLLQKAEQCRAGFTAACGQGGARAHMHQNFGMSGMGTEGMALVFGFVAWWFMSGRMLSGSHNKWLSNLLPIPIALAGGLFLANAVTNMVDHKDVSLHDFTQAGAQTVQTLSQATGIGQPRITRAAPVSDNWESIPPNNPLKPLKPAATAQPAPAQPAPRILPMQP